MGKRRNGAPAKARGGPRPGSGRKAGSHTAQTLVNAAAVQASQEVTAGMVLDRLRRAVEWDVRKLFDAAGQPLPIHKLDDDTAFLVQGVEYTTTNIDKGDGKLDRVVKIKVEPRSRYVEMAAKYHGMLVDKVKIEDVTPLREKVNRARARLHAELKAGKR